MPLFSKSGAAVTAAAFLLAASVVVAQTKGDAAKASNPTSGEDLYRSYCASCHGVDGRGHGPAADALKTAPTDLTLIVKHSNGKFDTRAVKRVITGEKSTPAHERDMPNWGANFKQNGANQQMIDARITSLADYIQKIQR